MASSSSTSSSTPSEPQRGGFIITFTSKQSRDYFVDQFSKTEQHFSSGGALKLVPEPDVSFAKGSYVALADVNVLEFLQFAVNKTFIPTLTALDDGAFRSGRSPGTVSITVTEEEGGDDVPKRLAVSNAISKTIIINANNLDRDISVLIAFVDPNNDQLFSTQFPTAWRVAYFSKGLNNSFNATYSAQYAIGAVQLVNGNLVTPTVWTDTSPGDVWSLTFSNNTYHFNKTKSGDPTQAFAPINIENNTGGVNPLAIGFDTNGLFNVALVQKTVGNTQYARFSFTPVLNAWVISDINQGEILSSEILSPPLFGEGVNLLRLTPVTTYQLIQNADGSYNITS